MNEAVPQAAAGRATFWCATCKEPVLLRGRALIPVLRQAVHAATGFETGPGGEGGSHAARPTDEDPVLRAEADSIEADYPDFKVSARFGVFRATRRRHLLAAGAVVPACTAATTGELRERLGAAAGQRAVLL